MARSRKKPYSGSKAWDGSCRNHGRCSYCVGGRTFASKRRMPAPPQEGEDIHSAELRLWDSDASEASGVES